MLQYPQNNVTIHFMETDIKILDLVNSIDFKQAMWSEEINNTHVFDFGSLTIRIKTYPTTEGANITAIGDVPCNIPFKSYEDFVTKLKDCKESMRDKAVKALIELKNTQKPVDTASTSRTKDKIRELEKAMQVDLHTEDGDYFGDVDWDISKEDEKKEKKFWKASEIAGDYFIRVRDDVITPLDDTYESRKLFGKRDRDYFAPLFVLCNKMRFKNYDEAEEKAQEMYGFVHGTNEDDNQK